jgi:hypothetical protein
VRRKREPNLRHNQTLFDYLPAAAPAADLQREFFLKLSATWLAWDRAPAKRKCVVIQMDESTMHRE